MPCAPGNGRGLGIPRHANAVEADAVARQADDLPGRLFGVGPGLALQMGGSEEFPGAGVVGVAFDPRGEQIHNGVVLVVVEEFLGL